MLLSLSLLSLLLFVLSRRSLASSWGQVRFRQGTNTMISISGPEMSLPNLKISHLKAYLKKKLNLPKRYNPPSKKKTKQLFRSKPSQVDDINLDITPQLDNPHAMRPRPLMLSLSMTPTTRSWPLAFPFPVKTYSYKVTSYFCYYDKGPKIQHNLSILGA